MKTYIVKLVVVDDLGHGDLEHPQAQYFLAKLCVHLHLCIYIT